MTRDEFRRQLDGLHTQVTVGYLYYEIWKALSSNEETADALNLYKGFFVPVQLAFLDMLVIQFYKAFDKHPMAVSLRRLLEAARNDHTLVPNSDEQQLGGIHNGISKLENDEVLKSSNEEGINT